SQEYTTHCNHIKVITNQGQIQNQNCAKMGVVNTQCDQVFVMATTDMMNGEGLVNVSTILNSKYR
ncbi:hypothetical protein F5877DRAFT_48494, partial [Lentinula edodes]